MSREMLGASRQRGVRPERDAGASHSESALSVGSWKPMARHLILVFHDYVVAHGYGETSSEAYELASGESAGNDYYALLLAAEIVAQDLVFETKMRLILWML